MPTANKPGSGLKGLMHKKVAGIPVPVLAVGGAALAYILLKGGPGAANTPDAAGYDPGVGGAGSGGGGDVGSGGVGGITGGGYLYPPTAIRPIGFGRNQRQVRRLKSRLRQQRNTNRRQNRQIRRIERKVGLPTRHRQQRNGTTRGLPGSAPIRRTAVRPHPRMTKIGAPNAIELKS
jgi:hypothetical protein